MCYHRFIFILLCVVSFLVSCRNEQEEKTYRYLAHVDSVIDQNPQEADSILDLMEPSIKEMPVDAQMEWRLFNANAKIQLGKRHFESSEFTDVADYYENNGNVNLRMKAYLILGSLYIAEHKYPMALKTLYKGVESADTLDSHFKYRTLMCIWSFIAKTYYRQHLPEQEIMAQKKSIEYAQKANIIDDVLLYNALLIRAYKNLNDTNLIIKQSEKAIALHKKYNHPKRAAGLYTEIVRIHLNRGEYDKAYKYIKIIDEQSDMFDENHKLYPIYVYYNYTLGLYQLGMHNYDSARYHFNQLLCNKYKYRKEAYDGLLRLYQAKKDADSITKYSELYKHAIDSILSEQHISEVSNAKMEHEIAMYKLSVERHQNRWIFVRIAFCVMFLFGICALTYWHKGNKKKNQKQIDELNAILADTEHKTQTVTTQNEVLRSQMNAIKVLNDENEFFSSDLVAKIRVSKEFMNQIDWDEMYNLVAKCMPVFNHVITEAKMSSLERKVCVLVRMGMSNTDMCTIMGLEPSSITNTKSRANKKLCGKASATNLLDTILSMEKQGGIINNE